jgi:hypothetical protein
VRIEVDFLKKNLEYLETKLDVKNIQKIEDIYSNVILLDNIIYLKNELERECPISELSPLELDDYIGVIIVTLLDGVKYQYAAIYHTNFDRKFAFFKRVQDYPSFAIRKSRIYENGFCYPVLDMSPKEPIKMIL